MSFDQDSRGYIFSFPSISQVLADIEMAQTLQAQAKDIKPEVRALSEVPSLGRFCFIVFLGMNNYEEWNFIHCLDRFAVQNFEFPAPSCDTGLVVGKGSGLEVTLVHPRTEMTGLPVLWSRYSLKHCHHIADIWAF